jgi:hypothetical protein
VGDIAVADHLADRGPGEGPLDTPDHRGTESEASADERAT